MSGDGLALLSPGEIAELREAHDLTFFEPPLEAAPSEAERECNRLLRALGVVRAEMAANQRLHADEVVRAGQWLSRVNRTPKRTEQWLVTMLEAVAPFVRLFGDKKSRDLPYGEIAWRTKPKRLVIDDPAAAVVWAKALGMPTKVEETVAHADLTRAWKEMGTTPPGCTVVPAEETFFATPSDVA